MFEHKTFKALDRFRKYDSILTAIGMVTIMALALAAAILIFI